MDRSTFDTLLKKRSAQKGHLTRFVKKLQDLCEQRDKDFDVIEDTVTEVKNRLDILSNVQEEIEILVDETDLEKYIQDFHEFCETVKSVKFKASKILRDYHSKQNDLNNDAESVCSSSAGVSAKLPKINLPHFSGNVMEWMSFWDQFKVIIHETDLPPVTKFTYLRSVLRDEAKAAIQGLSLTDANYTSAVLTLEERYGRRERIVASHIDALLNIQIPMSMQPQTLWDLFDELQGHVRALDNLEINGEKYGILLTPIILSKLPQELRMEWAREEGHDGELDFLLNFLKLEIGRRERSVPMVNQHHKISETASALVSSSGHTAVVSKKQSMCAICQRTNHKTDKCFMLTKIPISERRDILRQHHVCFKCLTGDKQHIFKKCRAVCKNCGEGHHGLLCLAKKEKVSNKNVTVKNRPDENEIVSHVSLTQQATSCVLLQVLKVKVAGKTGSTEAIVLCDTGADRSYISQKLVDKIGPKWIGSQEVAFANFGSTSAGSIEPRNVFSVNMSGIDKDISINLTEIPDICAPLSQQTVPKNIIDSFGGQMNIVSVDSGKLTIDMLLGLDWYWHIVLGHCKHITDSLVAQKTMFGWMISGRLENHGFAHTHSDVSHQLLCIDTKQNFWDLELIGIKSPEIKESSSNQAILNKFNENIVYRNPPGRYEVSLPWKDESCKDKLMNNFNLAKARLNRLSTKLEKDSALQKKYHETILTMKNMSIVEEIPELELESEVGRPTYYMPHRPVIKETSLTTKVRPVFDASAKGYNGVSLNDCMEAGPNLIPDLPGVLMRFCRWQIAISADIHKAFLMVGVKKEDQDVHRFLWDDDGIVRVMKFTRVPFGNASSMFLLIATIRYHLSQCTDSYTVCELKENMYVDNLLTGCDSIKNACELTREAKDIMDRAGMKLTQWGSNCDKIGQFVNCEFGDKCIGDESLKVLGMKWVASEDMLVYDCALSYPHNTILTKKVMLGFISKFFDPLGFAMPFIITGRILFQSLWKLNLDWNHIVPQWISEKFDSWVRGLVILNDWKIPRKFTQSLWNDLSCIEIHAFGDASPYAYGACVYLRMLPPNGKWFVSLVFAKARVAPTKQLTLPRLELLGSLICARLATYVLKELRLTERAVLHCWTDSTVSLAWIQKEPWHWKTFVQNRVTEIQALVPPDNWHFCPGKDNPADLLTRGVSAEVLTNSKTWLEGPGFLKEKLQTWPQSDDGEISESVKQDVEAEKRNDNVALTSVVDKPNRTFEVERWSSWLKAIRVTAFVLKFIKILKRVPNSTTHISFSDLCEAKTALIRDYQRSTYPDEYSVLAIGKQISRRSSISKLEPQMDSDGLMRIQGRLQGSLLGTDEKNPIIIPKGHFALLLARYTHSAHNHAGVNSLLVHLRNHYWIVSARTICKRVIHQCVSCRRHDSRAARESTAPLPAIRVRPAPPFSITGLDHGGPLFCSDRPGKKLYILLFTCAVTRAIHLELVESLSGEATHLAIRRFMARRGVPSVIMSDNAKNFKYVSEIFRDSFGPDGPKWRFIPPLSPWWGGFWERMIGLVKQGLRKTIGRGRLGFSELETVLQEMEMVLNSRPLTFVGDGLEDGEVLTPAHFLIGRKTMSKVDINEDCILRPGSSALDLISRWECQSEAVEKFWHFWTSNYLRNLPPFKGLIANGVIQEGELVLIRDEITPRLKWPMGLVIKVFPGVDGLSRMVELKTEKGNLIRPIQKLHSLEVVRVQDELPQITKTDSPVVEKLVVDSDSAGQRKSRVGRILKKPHKYDI